jgi:hypothetical protein
MLLRGFRYSEGKEATVPLLSAWLHILHAISVDIFSQAKDANMAVTFRSAHAAPDDDIVR